MISATIYGRLTKEPEVCMPKNAGESYVRFTVAVDTGKKEKQAQYVSIATFGKQKDLIQTHFHKGQRVVCHVRNLEASAYISKQSGDAIPQLNAVLVGVEFVETKADAEAQGYGQPAPQGYQAPPQGYQAAPAYAPQPQPQAYTPQPPAYTPQPPVAPQAPTAVPGTVPPMPGNVPWQG